MYGRERERMSKPACFQGYYKPPLWVKKLFRKIEFKDKVSNFVNLNIMFLSQLSQQLYLSHLFV